MMMRKRPSSHTSPEQGNTPANSARSESGRKTERNSRSAADSPTRNGNRRRRSERPSHIGSADYLPRACRGFLLFCGFAAIEQRLAGTRPQRARRGEGALNLRLGQFLTNPHNIRVYSCYSWLEFLLSMNSETLHIGMKVRHPQYGVGTVKSLTAQTAEIEFDDVLRTVAPASSDLQPAEPTATLSELQLPLAKLIHDTAYAVVESLGLEPPDALVEGLGARWQKGTLVMQPADTSLQAKEVPLETFFHKIVMIRNNLRVLEQKVNASDKLSEADKFDLQQYITRCYGSLTTFNILFRSKDDQFRAST